MKIDLRVPISPTHGFFRRIEYLVRSLRAAGGHISKARVVVSVGADAEPFDIEAVNPWSRGQVHWRWVDREMFRRLSYHATVLDRYFDGGDADIVIHVDADVLFVKEIDDLLVSLAATPAVGGVIAHVPPFSARADQTSWRQLFENVGLPFPRDLHQHTGYGTMFRDPRHRFCPAYFNMGAIFLPRPLLTKLASGFSRWLDRAAGLDVGYFLSQLALTFAIYELDLPRVSLDLRYNFPNDQRFEDAYPQDLADMRILHYLRDKIIHRDGDLDTIDSVRRLVARRDLNKSNEIFRSLIERLSPELRT